MTTEDSWTDVVPENDSSDESSFGEYTFGSNESEDSFEDLGLTAAKPFDMKLLKDSIDIGSKVLDHIEGKNVVLVIGRTGAGKSTFIQGIAGKQLEKTTHYTDCDEKTVENCVFGAKDPLEDFKIGHDKTSETKAFRCFVPDEQGDVVYIDTPGFEDTNHAEIDISTSVMLSRVSKVCKSIKFVVLVNCASLREDRGGAARSILRFTRAFVEDFSKEQRGFVFLFTHADHITNVPDSRLEAARVSLLDELLRLKKGTGSNDKDLLSLLKFLTLCLQKKMLHADVLHPLESNFKKLKKFIETKQVPIENPTIADSCGLTASSKHRLLSEVMRILLESRKQMCEPVNADSVKENHQLLVYLASQLNFGDIVKAKDESESLVKRYIEESKNKMGIEIERGGLNDSFFTIDDAIDIRETLSNLQKFDATSMSEYFNEKLRHQLECMEEALSLLNGEMNYTDARALDKLRLWGMAFLEHEKYYSQVLDRLKVSISSSIQRVQGFDLNMDLQQESIALFCRDICFLNSIYQQNENLSHHELDFGRLHDAQVAVDQRISEFLTSSNRDEISDLESDLVDEVILQKIAVLSRMLKWLQHGLVGWKGFEDTLSSISQLISELEGIVPSRFEKMCVDAKDCEIDKECLYRIKGVLQICSGVEGFDSGNMHQSFQRLVDVIKERMRSMSLSFLQTSLPSKKLQDDDINGQEVGLGLNKLAAQAWFDEFLPEGTSMISKACMDVQEEYEHLSEKIGDKILELLDFKNVKCPDAFAKQTPGIRRRDIYALKQMKGHYSQFVEIESFACITHNETILAKCTKVRSEISSLLARSMNSIKDSSNSSEYDLACSTKTERYILKSNAHLEEIDLHQAIARDQGDLEVLQSTKDAVLAKIDSFAREVNQVFEYGIDFETMAILLCVLETSGCDRNSFVSTRIPSPANSKEKARQSIMNQFEKVRTLITETSDWEEIDKEISMLQKGLSLDNILQGQVANYLNTLNDLLKNKETRVDSAIHEMIEAENYSGIWEFLEPLASSKDQLQRQKFNSYLGEMDKSLRKRFGRSADFLPRGLPQVEITVRIVENLDKLNEIHGELLNLSRYGKSRISGIQKLQQSLKKETDCVRAKLNEKLRESLNQMESDAKKLNFTSLTLEQKRAAEFVDISKKYLIQNNIKRHCKIQDDFNSMLESLPSLIEQLIKSNFEDATKLVPIFCALRQAWLVGDDSFGNLPAFYDRARQDLNITLRGRIKVVHKVVHELHGFADCIAVLRKLQRHLNSGLKEHIEDDIVVDVEKLIEVCVKGQQERMAFFLQTNVQKDKHEEIAKKLDKLDPSNPSLRATFAKVTSFFYGGSEYESLKNQTELFCSEAYNEGRAALQKGDYAILDDRLELLLKWDLAVNKHVKSITKKIVSLKSDSRQKFLDTCRQLKMSVEGGSTVQYKGAFDDFREMISKFSFILETEDCQRAFSLTNQLFSEKLDQEIERLKDALTLKSSLDFLDIKSIVEDARSHGGFMADYYPVFFEQMKSHCIAGEDPWIKKIDITCRTHFDEGRDYQNIKHYITLGVVPSASYKDIKRAFRLLAKKYHPDKDQNENAHERFLKIKESWDALDHEDRINARLRRKPFDRLIRGFGDCLLGSVRENLRFQRYDSVAQLLDRLSSLRELDDLVTPPLDSKRLESSVNDLVCNHVEQARISVDTFWSERKYKELQEEIDDLRKMENQFKSHSSVFGRSWNDGIVTKIQSEVLELAKAARLCLVSHSTAKERKEDFRRLFLQMGHVLIELPLFKDFTKDSISSVLKSCLDEAWGYSYLFELGLSLQERDCDDEDKSRIGQLLLSEFSHFKEVMTMVWNEETTQKPVEDTVKDIRGYIREPSKAPRQLDIQREQLLNHFLRFETKYKMLLGEYLHADADINALVRKTTKLSEQMKPISCADGWSEKIKGCVPDLLAGIFTLFTVLKSGEAYNRLESSGESSEFGEKLLMKPHNIQVLTLLCMFGCGRPSETNLESQLMQIRTGEGKSIILGAAAAVLGLLGFRVRCVCYSEYLSCRDYRLFEDVFRKFQIADDIVYSKITALSEDTTAAKGDIRYLTESLVLNNLAEASKRVSKNSILQQVSANIVGAIKRSTGTKTSSSVNPSFANEKAHSAPTIGSSEKLGQNHQFERIATSHQRTQESSIKQRKSSETFSSNSVINFLTGTSRKPKEEILLVDEVDVFFGPDFYGQTYNQVAQLREPEIADLLKSIWREQSCNGRSPRLSDLKSGEPYQSLLRKMQGFEFLLDNEISLMLKHVKRVDEEPYFLDEAEQRIGYKVMDSVSYNVTYGYRTVFAYLQEYDRGSVKNETLQRMLTMPVSCGQFSYAQIAPTRILGVSGTLEVMTKYEKEVLARYGVQTYLHVPSVYGKSNFTFVEGDGITIECSKSDFYHMVCDEIRRVTSQNRAVIVFFKDMASIKEFTSSAFYHKLGRQKKVLSEDMVASEKDFVINKAATAKQITICPAVFGRGTDFFCKDGKVEKSGGVHVIQTFLSEQRSEEVQMQGRTARQGKQGSYKLILLEDDLVQTFGVVKGEQQGIPKANWYKWLCTVRDKRAEMHSKEVEKNLAEATKKDKNTHKYFDALLASNPASAKSLFKEIYLAMKRPIPSTVVLNMALAIDVTGSMHPFSRDLPSMLNKLLQGQDSITAKLSAQFPELDFKLRVGVLGFRDIDDKEKQFEEKIWSNGSHFTSNMNSVVSKIQKMVSASSGGHDLAEDAFGAIHRTAKWEENGDWSGTVNCLLILTDAPAHGLTPSKYSSVQNGDSYGVRHPAGLTAESVAGDLLARDIDLFFCSFNPAATTRTEKSLANAYLKHEQNSDEKEVSCIPMVQPKSHLSDTFQTTLSSKHIIFILDESGSMKYEWPGVVQAYNRYIARRIQSQCTLDLVSVVQFDSTARLTVDVQPITSTPNNLGYSGHGTCFSPAASLGFEAARKSPSSHTPIIVFMSDGATSYSDASYASQRFSELSATVLRRYNCDLELHVIAFGGGADTQQLLDISRSSKNGRLHTSDDAAALCQVFESIASGENVTALVESQVGKRISDAVANKLSLEYIG